MCVVFQIPSGRWEGDLLQIFSVAAKIFKMPTKIRQIAQGCIHVHLRIQYCCVLINYYLCFYQNLTVKRVNKHVRMYPDVYTVHYTCTQIACM